MFELNDIACNENIHSHHVVEKDSKTTEKRITYNCSLEGGEASVKANLNDCLYSGLSLINQLTTVLSRFRTNMYAK